MIFSLCEHCSGLIQLSNCMVSGSGRATSRLPKKKSGVGASPHGKELPVHEQQPAPKRKSRGQFGLSLLGRAREEAQLCWPQTAEDYNGNFESVKEK